MNICFIGTGYVGLVSGVLFSDFGHSVFCVDKDAEKISNLENGIIPIYEPGLEELVLKNFDAKRIKFTTDINNAIKKSQVIFIAVGTPTSKNGSSADLTGVFNVAKIITNNINSYKIIVTKSTVPLGTGDKIEKIISKKNSKNLFDVVSNPEFLREGEAIRDFRYPDRVVIGTNNPKKVSPIMEKLYAPIIKKGGKFLVVQRRAAELIKYAANAFLATKITFINEMANLCEKTGINIEDISLGIGTDARIGSRFLRAGPAYGGSCFPKDTKALASTGKEFKVDLTLVQSVVGSNDNRSSLITSKILKILKKPKNKKVTFLGVTFKANTDDMRDSSCLKIIPSLIKKGCMISYFEPTGQKKILDRYKSVKHIDNIEEAIQLSDLVIIHTEWDEFKSLDFEKIRNKKNLLIYDLRNLYDPDYFLNKNIKYHSIGRPFNA
jgi:UDPglucose 6-dehydrogenase